jgi:hypothetical protein
MAPEKVVDVVSLFFFHVGHDSIYGSPRPLQPENRFFDLEKGDQIGRIFAHWAIVYFGQFLDNNKSRPNF